MFIIFFRVFLLVIGGEFMESNRRDALEAVLDQDDIQRVKNFNNLFKI